MIRSPASVISPSRTYVVFTYVFGEKGVIKPKIVKLSEDKPNIGTQAIWQYVREDQVSMMENLVLTKEEFDSAD